MTHPLASRIVALTGLLACLAMLAAGSASLPAPPLHPVETSEWWAASDPALALGSLLRLVAMALCAWLAIVTTGETIATAAGLSRSAGVLRGLTPAVWRALVLRPLTVGALAVPALVAPLGLTSVAAAETADVDAIEDATSLLTMTIVSPPTSEVTTTSQPPADPSTTTTTSTPSTVPTSTTMPTGGDSGGELTIRVPHDHQDHILTSPPIEMRWPDDPATPDPVVDDLQPEPAPDDPTSTPPPGDRGRETPTSPDVPRLSDSPPDVTTHVIEPGDSFWRIAADRVASSLGREPTALEIAPYWRATVALNEGRLPVPGNPDLLFPGDEILLPPI